MRQNFLTKMYDGQSEVSGYSQPHKVKGYSLQQVSDAFDAGEAWSDYTNYVNANVAPSKEQYLSNLAPAPDVKEVSVAFWEYTINNSKDCPDIGNNVWDIFDYWYTNIYSPSKKQ